MNYVNEKISAHFIESQLVTNTATRVTTNLVTSLQLFSLFLSLTLRIVKSQVVYWLTNGGLFGVMMKCLRQLASPTTP